VRLARESPVKKYDTRQSTIRIACVDSGIAYGTEFARLFFLAAFSGGRDFHAAFREGEDVLDGDLVIGHHASQQLGTRVSVGLSLVGTKFVDAGLQFRFPVCFLLVV
jgi:hypothetical protein